MCLPWKNKYSHALNSNMQQCINIDLCVLLARQSSGLQLACSPPAHSHLETQMCVYVCVCEAVCMKEGSQVQAPDLLTQLQLYDQECSERRKSGKKASSV